jgi:hypothetical protein
LSTSDKSTAKRHEPTQQRISLDASILKAVEAGKAAADQRARDDGRKAHTFQSYIAGLLAELRETVGFSEAVISDAGDSLILSPPTPSDGSSVRISLRLTNPDVLADIDALVTQTGRPKPHVIYTLIRACVRRLDMSGQLLRPLRRA